MLTLAVRGLRSRWMSFLGGFLALALGVGVLATTGLALAASLDPPLRSPERFARAAVVVQGDATLRAPSPIGVRTAPLDARRALPAALRTRLAGIGRVTEDRSFPLTVRGGPAGLVGHPWATARFSPYALTSGRAPRAADEVVVAGDWTRPGRTLRTDRGRLRVTGTVRALPFERAVFTNGATAARLAPRLVRVVVTGAEPAAVRAAVEAETTAHTTTGGTVDVLTGGARRAADEGQEREAQALVSVNALLGTAAGVTGFVSVFVVASTFAFAVAQRRREFGLLRAAGATPGQIRRLVLAEAGLVGVAASATGCALGAQGAPLLTRWLVDERVAPAWFTTGGQNWPFHVAFWTGLLVALAGAATASWRAGRTGPTAALRTADTDHGTLTRGRSAGGALLLAAGLGTLGWALYSDPGDLLHRKTYMTRPMPLIVGCALLAPLVLGRFVRLLTWLPARLPGAAWTLVGESAAGAVRRTAAVAAPVLVTVALAGSLLGTVATLNSAKSGESAAHTRADLVVRPSGPEPADGGGGFTAATVRELRAAADSAAPGSVVAASGRTSVFAREDGVALVKSGARAVDRDLGPAGLDSTVRLPLVAGSLSDLDDSSIVVNEEWARHRVGDTVRVWRGDGTPVSLRIAAVLRTGTGDNGAYVTARNAPGSVVDRVDVRLAPGADRAAVARVLRAAAGPGGAEVLTRAQWVRATAPGTARATRLGFALVLGIALLYTGFGLAGTQFMATADRRREFAALRLAGATRAQILRLVTAESLVVVAVGALLGLAVTAVNLGGVSAALAALRVGGAPVLPWSALAAVTAVCAVLVTASGLASAWRPSGGRGVGS